MRFDPKTGNRHSIRLQSYDYRQAGAYFVTVCTEDRRCLFGGVEDGSMVLSRCGEIVVEEWLAVPLHRPGIELDAFVLMPNHFHGLLVVEDGLCRGTACRAQVGFKSAVTRQINLERETPGGVVWQRNYFERIVRDERMLNAFRVYIQNNPLSWEKDEDFIPDSGSTRHRAR